MRVRLGLGAVVVNVALLLICVTAWACVTSSGSVSPGSAGPGDPISFSISGVQPGDCLHGPNRGAAGRKRC